MGEGRKYAALIITVSILLCVIMPVNVLGAEKKKDNETEEKIIISGYLNCVKQKHPDLPVWAFDSRAWGATSPDRKIGKAITEPRGP